MLEKKRTERVSNWGNFPYLYSNVIDFKKETTKNLLLNKDEKFLPRGNGRCYGDAALNKILISTLNLNCFLDFDTSAEEIECESGMLLSEILEFIIPRGFFLPVTPGTKFITVGGAIASDVHGKNHHVDGCFSEFVKHFDIQIDTGEVVRCSREVNSDLFWESIGGMGLTGIILSARFKLKKIESAYIYQEKLKAKNLDEIINLFEQSNDWTYTVAWIDCLKKGKGFGRSILMRGEHANLSQLPTKLQKSPLDINKKLNLNVPFYFPNFFLNKLFVQIFNLIYYSKQFKKITKNIISYDSFFYPLDSIQNWNRIYGKKGFIQYQFVIPKKSGKSALKEILKEINNSRQGSFLAVLKVFGSNNKLATNSFPIKGYTLALDFKVNNRLFDLIPRLDSLIIKHKGRIYRAKDSLSKPILTNYVKTSSNKFDSVQNQRIMKNKNL